MKAESTLSLARSAGPVRNTACPHWEPTWAELGEMLSAPIVREDKDGPYFVVGALANSRRSNKNISDVAGIVIDGDATLNQDGTSTAGAPCPRDAEAALLQAGWPFLIYTSHSHIDKGNRWRAFLPVSGATAQDLAGLVEYVLKYLRSMGVMVADAKENTALSQPWYLPSVPNEQRLEDYYHCQHNGTKQIDVEAVRSSAQLDIACSKEVSIKPKEVSSKPIGVCSVISQFNDKHNADWIVSTLQSNGYTLAKEEGSANGAPSRKLLPPNSSTGVAGTNVYSDTKGQPRVTSFNGSSDISNSTGLDAWDVNVQFNFNGDKKRAWAQWSSELEGKNSYVGLDLHNVIGPIDPDKPHPLTLYRPPVPDVPKKDDMLIEGILCAKVSFLGAYAGAGKTTAMAPLVLVVAGLIDVEGMEVLGWRNVIYISEHPEQFELSLKALSVHYKLDPVLVAQRIKVVTAERMSAPRIVEAVPVFKELSVPQKENNVTVVLQPWVVIDTQASTLHLENENDAAEASDAMSTLKKHFDGVPLTIVAHTSKANKRGDVEAMTIRGSGAFEGDCNQVMLLSFDAESGQRFIEIGFPKHRFTATVDALAVEFHTLCLKLEDRFERVVSVPVGFCTLEPVTAAEKVQMKEAEKEKVIDRNRLEKQQLALTTADTVIDEADAAKVVLGKTSLVTAIMAKKVVGFKSKATVLKVVTGLLECGAINQENVDFDALTAEGWEVDPRITTRMKRARNLLFMGFDEGDSDDE